MPAGRHAERGQRTDDGGGAAGEGRRAGRPAPPPAGSSASARSLSLVCSASSTSSATVGDCTWPASRAPAGAVAARDAAGRDVDAALGSSRARSRPAARAGSGSRTSEPGRTRPASTDSALTGDTIPEPT